MKPLHQIIIFAFIVTLISPLHSQSPTSSRQLDSLLQTYAYRAFHHPRTGTIYDAVPPANLTGIAISVLRLKNGSLRFRGVDAYKEFAIPSGVIVQPYVERLVFVYQNLHNWSSVYYPLPGYTHLTPIVGLLAYDAANLSGTNLNELDIVASNLPIKIKFLNVKAAPLGFTKKCVWFDLDGLPEFHDLVESNMCETYRQGHFSIVVNSTEVGPPTGEGQGHKWRLWKIVAVVVGGFISLVILSLILCCLCRYRKEKKVEKMERRAEMDESLQMARVGTTQAPVASGTRTQPVLEKEYAA